MAQALVLHTERVAELPSVHRCSPAGEHCEHALGEQPAVCGGLLRRVFVDRDVDRPFVGGVQVEIQSGLELNFDRSLN